MEHSFGQNQVVGSGNGGDGVFGGATTSSESTIDDCFSYLKEVRVTFQDQMEKFEMFIEIMRDFKAQRIDTYEVIKRVKELFKGKNNLILGFQKFLPKGYAIIVDKDEAPPFFEQNQVTGSSNDSGGDDVCEEVTTSKKVTVEEISSYLMEVQVEFKDQRGKFDMFLKIMKDFKAQKINTKGVITLVKDLFKGHNELILGFQNFLPYGYEITIDKDGDPNLGENQVPVSGNGDDVHGEATSHPKPTMKDALSYLKEVKVAFKDSRVKYDMLYEIFNDFKNERINTNDVITRVKEVLKGHNNLILGFQTFLPEGYEITIDKDEAPSK